MKKLETLFENNKSWREKLLSQDSQYFERLAQEQAPKQLWIGCSDSRVPASEIVGLEPGELFVHRNIANLCVHTDLSFLSVLEYAVAALKVEHVIVCGHYGCGGVKAALENKKLGVIDNWLRNIRDISFKHRNTLEKLPSQEAKFQRLVELNVEEQVKNVSHTSIIQEAWKEGRSLSVHGWVYDLKNGKLIDLEKSFSGSNQIDLSYRLE